MKLLRLSVISLCLLGLGACMPPGEGAEGGAPEYRLSTTPPRVALKGNVPLITEQLQQNIPEGTPVVKIGLLLPLSGESQALGKAMLDAAQLALYDRYVSLKPGEITARIELLPKDTGSSATTATEAANDVLAQGAKLIIGPLFSPSTSAVTPLARRAGVPVLSLSNNRAVAGQGVYIFGFAPEQQAARVAGYAARRDVEPVASLLPSDPYGKAVGDALKESLGGRVEPTETYTRSSANIDAAADRLKQEYDKKPFKALMLGEGGEQVKPLLASLKAKGLGRANLQLLGTGLWDEEAVRKNPDLRGGWFASSPPQYYDAYEKRFMTVYGYKPQRLSSLSYDAVTLAVTLALSGRGPNFSDAVLTNPRGFVSPANGLYRLRADGTSERALSVMEVQPDGFRVLDTAPRTW